MSFSQDGQLLVSLGLDSTVILWDVHSRRRIGGLAKGHNDEVSGVAFSPDARMLVTGGYDGKEGSVILWDTQSLQRIGGLFLGNIDEVRSMTFSPDGRFLAVGGTDGNTGTVILIEFGSESWKEQACRIANRNLTQTEWERYFGNEPYHKTCPDLPEVE